MNSTSSLSVERWFGCGRHHKPTVGFAEAAARPREASRGADSRGGGRASTLGSLQRLGSCIRRATARCSSSCYPSCLRRAIIGRSTTFSRSSGRHAAAGCRRGSITPRSTGSRTSSRSFVLFSPTRAPCPKWTCWRTARSLFASATVRFGLPGRRRSCRGGSRLNFSKGRRSDPHAGRIHAGRAAGLCLRIRSRLTGHINRIKTFLF